MFIDGRTLPAGSVIETDIAIIGAGAVGITLARELRGSSRAVTLIESGGLELEADTQALYEGESGGVEYPLAESRLRFFGGTTNHWGGWCRPLLPLDFEGRDALGIPAWPITRADLDPYYRRAQAICQLGAFDFDDPEPWEARTGLAPIALPGDDLVTRFFIYSPPTRFGEVYRDDVAKAANVNTYLNSNVVEILPNEAANRIERLKVATLGGNGFEIRPRLCILAVGGIENARLLLASNSVQAAGLGNGNDLVGRYFMEHVTAPGDVAAIALADETRLPYYYVHTPDVDRASMRAILMPSDAYLKRSNGLGISLSLYESHKPGAAPLEPAVIAMLKSLGGDAALSGMIYGVACALEPLPSAENRVTLIGDRDALGLPRSRLTWRPTRAERDALTNNLDALARSFGAWGGAVKLLVPEGADWSDDEIGWGNHHMGTTRMSADPKRGVVDANGRVHGIGNLLVAGSSVFPSCGAVNPTFTIVALALRMADHIKGGSLG
ncbi:GMC oxidoreductase [Dongia sp.]|uniref:GMC oxidoreductase n=1 Tax=Dongia sp. TaxID=1977262 RepID=UPI00375296FF